MISGKTESGFAFELDEEVLNDLELIENLKAVDKGDISVLPEVCEAVLGKEQKRAYNDHMRSLYGRVQIDKIAIELGEIFKASKTLKN